MRLGTQVVDEVRRRVQQDTVGHRGHKDDPLYKIRGLLGHGVEHLTERQQTKIIACLRGRMEDTRTTRTAPGSVLPGCQEGWAATT